MDGFHLKRRLFHMTNGFLFSFLIYYDYFNAKIAGIVIIIGFILSMIDKHLFKIPVIHNIAIQLDRKKDLKEMPGKGAILYAVGLFLVLLLFEKNVAIACLLVLGIGDSIAPLVGRYGKWKNPIDKRKMIEGQIVGAICAAIAANFFVTSFEAVIASFMGMAVESYSKWNDNISIPLTVGIVIWIIRLF